MKEIAVNASKNYSVIIDSNILSCAGKYIANIVRPGKAVIVSDSNVWPLYGHSLKASLEESGFVIAEFVFPAGEESKNGQTYLSILEFLAQRQITRADLLIALGGGVVGDITGFAAATYLRGIPYVQVPTTLLAMVDSSVGGKTAIDLAAGKNLAGAFCQPELVLCDPGVLSTLPYPVFCDGCAEVVKYGVLYDETMFSHLESHGPSFDREYIISRCVALKRDVVAEDEFDTGARQKLNLGHTFGHGIERSSMYSVPHGQAVAAGMAIASRAAAHFQICDISVPERIARVLNAFSLPVSTNYSAEELFVAALSDKKRWGNSVNLILPERIGYCRIQSVAIHEVKSFIEAGL